MSSFAVSANEKENADTAFIFTDVKVNPTTSVKDQNKSGTCWSFSGLSFLEDELLKNGKGEYDLSEMFVVRQCYIDKAIQYIRYYGKSNFGEGGGLMDIPYVFDKYGMVPEEAYAGLEYGDRIVEINGETYNVTTDSEDNQIKVPTGENVTGEVVAVGGGYDPAKTTVTVNKAAGSKADVMKGTNNSWIVLNIAEGDVLVITHQTPKKPAEPLPEGQE